MDMLTCKDKWDTLLAKMNETLATPATMEELLKVAKDNLNLIRFMLIQGREDSTNSTNGRN